MRIFGPLIALLLLGAAPPATPNDAIAAATADEWTEIPADDLLVLDLASRGRVVIQLAPAFAPVHVGNVKALARSGYWQGAAIYRVHDNYVAQWGNNDSEKPLPAGVIAAPPAEYERPAAALAIRRLNHADPYAPIVGHADGWPVAAYPDGTASLVHCYATVGVGRGLQDTGMGGELYAVIGHGPRQLDRNIAIIGRVIEGIERLSSLPRGTEALGFYKERSQDVPIAMVRLASQIPNGDRPRFEFLSSTSASFAEYLRLRANRKDDFYQRPAGGVDICNAPVPVRRKSFT